MNDESKGISGLVGMIMAGLGIWTGLHPASKLVVIVTQHQAELHTVLTVGLSSLGGLVTYVAHPPAWLRGPLDRVKARLFGAVTLPAPPASDPVQRDAQLARAIGQEPHV